MAQPDRMPSGMSSAIALLIQTQNGTPVTVTNVRRNNTGSFTSVAAASTSSSNPTSITGTYGTLKIGADGSYIYTPSNSQANVQSLQEGQTVQDIFIYEATGPATGAPDTATLTITLSGKNDAPVANNDTATARELNEAGVAGIDPSGNVLANDSDC